MLILDNLNKNGQHCWHLFHLCFHQYQDIAIHINIVCICLLGLPNRNEERHVTEIANLALDVLHMSRNKKFPNSENTPVQLQIGINTGDNAFSAFVLCSF